MLYLLLYSLHSHLSVLNVFKYQTFRAMVAFLTSFVLVLIFQPIFINWLKNRGVRGQPIRDDGPKAHEEKRGTPTMGGLVVVGAVTFVSLLFADVSNRYVLILLSTMLGFSLLGFLDDWQKITKQNTKGISGPIRLIWEFGGSLTLGAILISLGFSSGIEVPFLKELAFNPGWLVFIVFAALVIVGTSNAVNLTDGLDGLAIGPIMTVAALYAIFAYVTGNVEMSKYLGIAYVPGVGETCVVLSAIVAAGLGFLWYNTFPAQVFMGDLGALGLGAALGMSAVLVKQEIVLVIAGGIFVLEAVSVIMQRYYYKLTGKRIFRMAPIHHHFELKGWAEPKIIVRFWIISIVLALIALTSLKLR